jgi:hypothetical protein
LKVLKWAFERFRFRSSRVGKETRRTVLILWGSWRGVVGGTVGPPVAGIVGRDVPPLNSPRKALCGIV